MTTASAPPLAARPLRRASKARRDWRGWAFVGPFMLVLALVAALALDSARLHGVGFFRIAIFLPYAVPGVVAALIWGFIYGNQFGLTGSINDLLGADVILPFSADWILASIGNIVTWEFMGY